MTTTNSTGGTGPVLVLRPGGRSAGVRWILVAFFLGLATFLAIDLAQTSVPAAAVCGVLFGVPAVFLVWFQRSAVLTVTPERVVYRRLWCTTEVSGREVFSVEVEVLPSKGHGQSGGVRPVIHASATALAVGALAQLNTPGGRAWVQERADAIITTLGGQDLLYRRMLPERLRTRDDAE